MAHRRDPDLPGGRTGRRRCVFDLDAELGMDRSSENRADTGAREEGSLHWGRLG